MHFKRLFSVFLISAFLQGLAAQAVLLDQIEATVNDALITRQDLIRAMVFYPILQERGQSAEDFRRMVLNELIDSKVVRFEFEDELTLKEEDYEAVQLAVIAKQGSLNALYNLLRRLGMSWADFKEYIRERVIYEKVLTERLESKAVISFREVEDFYQNHYLPLQKTLGLESRSLVEMAPQIENHLAKSRFGERLQGWLEDLRGGYRIEIMDGEE